MWTFVTQLLVTLVLLGFFLVSCQNVAHIVRGSLGFVLWGGTGPARSWDPGPGGLGLSLP